MHKLRGHQRIEGIVSRGGALLAAWMERTGHENPLYQHFDEVCAILREHDVTISLGDGLRPGATGEATGTAVAAVAAAIDRSRCA